ncbi:MAG: YcjF family protein [Methanococcaceae archaeon]
MRSRMVVNEENTTANEVADEDVDQAKLEAAQALVKKYMWWSMGAGLIPVPLVDMATVSGVQLKMLNELSKIYGVKFSKNAGKSIISALLGSISADALSKSYLTSVIKSIPIIGIVGSVSMPIYSGATTWAIGKVFIQHFATGGTFLDFDPKKVKDYFMKLFKQGQEVAQNLKTAKA